METDDPISSELFDTLRSEGDFGASVGMEKVEKLEAVLKVEFPSLVQTFFTEFGAGGVNGFEIYGIVKDPFTDGGIPNIVWVTEELRKDGAPHHFIPISDTGDGGYYCLDLSNFEEGQADCPVIYLNVAHLTDSAFDSFEKFLEYVLEE